MSPKIDFLTVEQAATLLKISPQRVRALISEKRLPATRLGKRTWVIRSKDLALVRVRRPGRPRTKGGRK